MRNFESGTPFVRSFFFGVFAWALALMVCYAIYFQTTQVYSFRLPERLLALRAPGSSVANESIFFDVAGNVNKVANYALLLIPLSALAYWRRLIPAQLHYANVTLLVVILMVTFSRGAFVAAGILAAIVVAAAAIEKWRRGRRVRHLVTLSAILVIPVGLSLSDPFFVDYWRNLDTVTARMEQATGVTETGDGSFPTATLLRLMGYGVGNYGRVEFGDSMRGTHNLFLDIWTNGGAVALAAFASLLAYSAFLGLRRWGQTGSDTSLVGTAGITTLVILGFREYDLAYLYATSMGGILVGIFCGLATALPVNYGKPSCS